MKRIPLYLLLFAVAVSARAQETAQETAAIGQPTIFWRNNEWETLRNGQWVPFWEPARQSAITPETPEAVPETAAAPAAPEPDNVQTNEFDPPLPYELPYGYGYVIDLPTGGPLGKHRHPHGAKPHVPGLGQSPAIGQPTTGPAIHTPGIGQRAPTVGERAPAIGERAPAIGQQPNAPIGQPNLFLGQPIGISQPSTPIGQPTSGNGQPTMGTQTTFGQPAFSTGQPAGFPGPR